MPEQFEQPRSIYQNEAQRNAAVAKLGRKITDVVKHKVGGVKTDDPRVLGASRRSSPTRWSTLATA